MSVHCKMLYCHNITSLCIGSIHEITLILTDLLDFKIILFIVFSLQEEDTSHYFLQTSSRLCFLFLITIFFKLPSSFMCLCLNQSEGIEPSSQDPQIRISKIEYSCSYYWNTNILSVYGKFYWICSVVILV